jgi:hypothetical protein
MHGNLLTGTALDAIRTTGLPSLPWLGMTTIGLLSTLAICTLDHTQQLTTLPPKRPTEH